MMFFLQPLKAPACRRSPREGFALIDAVIAIALVSVTLGCMSALNMHMLGTLRLGKESTYATELLQERVEQMRSALWDEVTDAAKLSNVLRPATITATNLPGVTETIDVEPLPNPSNLKVRCVRNAAGSISASGGRLTSEQSVKVTVSARWDSHNQTRSRGVVTILTNGGI